MNTIDQPTHAKAVKANLTDSSAAHMGAKAGAKTLTINGNKYPIPADAQANDPSVMAAKKALNDANSTGTINGKSINEQAGKREMSQIRLQLPPFGPEGKGMSTTEARQEAAMRFPDGQTGRNPDTLPAAKAKGASASSGTGIRTAAPRPVAVHAA